MEEKITTTENLITELLGCIDSAIVDYGNYTIAVWEHCHKGSIAEIYKLIEMPKEYELGRCECKISRIERKESFEDPGHAMKWALDKVVNGNMEYIKQEELPKYWETKVICIEFADGSDALAQENGYTLEQCMEMTDAKFFLD